MSENALYRFPPAPSPGMSEWPGSPVGVSNTITRTKGRTAVNNKTADQTPGLLDRLMGSVRDHIARLGGMQAVHQQDVIIHGIRVRAITNSDHLYDFWVDNWHSPDEWWQLTGQPASAEPRITVYALHGVTNEQEAAYYSRATNTIVFFNTSYYGQLKSWVLGAVGRILAAECGIHSIHGACVEKAGKGVLYIAPTGTGKSTSSYGLVTYPGTRFHSDDWVYVRYTYSTRDGQRVFVLSAEGSDGTRACGYQVYRWIERHALDRQARLIAMTLGNRELKLTLGDLAPERGLEAYAYTSEKVFYLRTNLVENFPLSAAEILASKEENVPDLAEGFRERHRSTLASMLADFKDPRHERLAELLRGKSDGELEQIAGRLIAFDNARSMLDIAKVLPADRVYTNPMEPCRLAAVMLLKRDTDDPTVLEHVHLNTFMERLLIGETPDKKRETAYNAYRAVDDKAERALIEELEKRATPSQPLYPLFEAASEKPVSLDEEFELFRVMYYAARTYALNTILQEDPTVPDKREAVRRTLALIARTLEEEPRGIRLTIDNYSAFLGESAARSWKSTA